MSTSLPTLTEKGRKAIDSIISDVIDNKKMPAVFMAATNADEVIYENQGGWVDFEHPEAGKVNAQTTLHMFSMTKFVTSVACHQLIDRGLLSLEDPQVIIKYLPELKDVDILEGYNGDGPILKKSKNPITLKMLLSHSAGMCYDWSGGDDMKKWCQQNGGGNYSTSKNSFNQPLIYEPGTDYRYSISIDWAGFLVERVSGKSLEDYFIEHIFRPCDMESTTFYPKPEITSRLFKPCTMDPATGELKVMKDSPLGKPTKVEDVKVLSGGGGLYGTTRDYLKFLQAILKCSPTYHSPPSNPLISQTAFKALFTPALETPKAIESLCQMMRGQFYHNPTPTPQNVQHSPGLALYLEDGEWGRKKGSGCWNGALKTIFWIDPTTGIAAECNTNILCPSNDNIVGRTITEFERTLYENLAT